MTLPRLRTLPRPLRWALDGALLGLLGFVLFLGTMFAPTKDRHGPGLGFTHVVGDVVTIGTPKLGALVNRVNTSDRIPPWTYGTGALMATLARRGLLSA